jgi:uncharacterized protein (DUF4415 family)
MKKTMRSAYAKRRLKSTGATPNDFSPLTEEELAEVRLLRAEAKERASKLADEMTDEEGARLTAAAEADPDSPPLTEEDWKRMRPAHEVHPHLVRKSLLRHRGRPKLAAPKRQVTLRLDADVLEHFKAGGSGWQTAINDVLRKALGKRGRNAASDGVKAHCKAV